VSHVADLTRLSNFNRAPKSDTTAIPLQKHRHNLHHHQKITAVY
jgi:hypothetical protein